METNPFADNRSIVPVNTGSMSSGPQWSRPTAPHIEIIKAPGAVVQMNFSDDPTFETLDFLEKYIVLRKSMLKKTEN